MRITRGGMLSVFSVAVVLSICAAAFASEAGPGISPGEALQKLLEGNLRYLSGQMTAQKLSDQATRQSLAKGQKPYAVILSCSDSRVPPEIIFDKGLGEIFVVRVAGNVPDPIILGSIEYAVEHLGSPLIVVLGHKRCGAVTAALEAKGVPEGNVGAILKALAPAVALAKKEAKGKDRPELVETAIDDNVKLVCASLTKQSKVLRHAVEEGKVRIVGAKYDLDDGVVKIMK
jgi:carbonic anhydrase